MDAGKLDKRITILEFVPNRDTNRGGSFNKGTYRPFATVWAQMKTSQSTVQGADGLMVYETIHKFYIRKRDGIRANMRISYAGRTFELTGEPVDWQNEEGGLTLKAREIT